MPEKNTTILLEMPPALLRALAMVAQYRQCSVEDLMIQLALADKIVQKYYSRESYVHWRETREE